MQPLHRLPTTATHPPSNPGQDIPLQVLNSTSSIGTNPAWATLAIERMSGDDALPYILTDAHGHSIYWSPSASRLFGYPDILGTDESRPILGCRDASASSTEELVALAQSGTPQFVSRQSLDGRTLTLLQRVSALDAAGLPLDLSVSFLSVQGFTIHLQDVTLMMAGSAAKTSTVTLASKTPKPDVVITTSINTATYLKTGSAYYTSLTHLLLESFHPASNLFIGYCTHLRPSAPSSVDLISSLTPANEFKNMVDGGMKERSQSRQTTLRFHILSLETSEGGVVKIEQEVYETHPEVAHLLETASSEFITLTPGQAQLLPPPLRPLSTSTCDHILCLPSSKDESVIGVIGVALAPETLSTDISHINSTLTSIRDRASLEIFRSAQLFTLRAEKRLADLAAKKKSSFLANVSHEIRTPVSAILGLTDMILWDTHRFSSANKSRLELISLSGEHLLAVINGVLDYSKIDDEDVKFQMHEAPLKLRKCVKEAVHLAALSPAAAKKKIIIVDGTKPIGATSKKLSRKSSSAAPAAAASEQDPLSSSSTECGSNHEHGSSASAPSVSSSSTTHVSSSSNSPPPPPSESTYSNHAKQPTDRTTAQKRTSVAAAVAMADLVRAGARDTCLPFMWTVDDSVPDWILGDVTRIRQVILNLLTNALKFTEEGSVTLTISRLNSIEQASAPVPLFEGQHHPTSLLSPSNPQPDPTDKAILLFTVVDTGCGMPPEKLNRLFQPYSQLDNSYNHDTAVGTGLGLAISFRLVQMMGGQIWVESSPGIGSKFSFCVPFPVVVNGSSSPDGSSSSSSATTNRSSSWSGVSSSSSSGASGVSEEEEEEEEDYEDESDSEGSGGVTSQESEAGTPPPPPLITTTGLLGVSRDSPSKKKRSRSVGGGGGWSTTQTQPAIPLCPNCQQSSSSIKPRRPLASPTRSTFTSSSRRSSHTLPPPPSPPTTPITTLTTRPSRPRSHTPKTPPLLSSTYPLSILVAEDNPINQQIALSLLKKMGYTADLAINGLEAVQLSATTPYDLFLMDLSMPVMDGIEATRRILSSRDVVVIATTASATVEDSERAREAGMRDWLNKPYRVSELEDKIRRHFSSTGTTSLPRPSNTLPPSIPRAAELTGSSSVSKTPPPTILVRKPTAESGVVQTCF